MKKNIFKLYTRADTKPECSTFNNSRKLTKRESHVLNGYPRHAVRPVIEIPSLELLLRVALQKVRVLARFPLRRFSRAFRLAHLVVRVGLVPKVAVVDGGVGGGGPQQRLVARLVKLAAGCRADGGGAE